ncbi:MAG: hypothetical protein J0H49_07980 [Acidobacteria bacterium]|nr:hypothetical protein [Acidobacteriota bacterium]
MPISANATLGVQVSGGPNVGVSWQISADGLDRITVTVPKAGNKSVDLQPAAADKLLLLIMSSSKYDALLTYKFDPAGSAYKLTQPQVLSGGDLAVKAGAAAGPISIANGTTADVTVDVFVLRKS